MNLLYAFIDTLAQFFQTTLFTYYFIAISFAFAVVLVRLLLDTLLRSDKNVGD